MGQASDRRLVDHVDRLAHEHPPIQLSSVDFAVARPRELDARFGHVLDYMARVELEVEKNVMELAILLPDPPEIDVHFFRDVWAPQEIQHGLILDELQRHLGRPLSTPDLSIGAKIKVLGALGHAGIFQDVSRMLYYLTGVATERSAVLAYNMLYDGIIELGEEGVARSAIGQIKRQEPGHFAFYQMSARQHWQRLAGWQKWLVRKMRGISFAPVGAYSAEQSADFGEIMATLGITEGLDDFTQQIARVERELLFASHEGLTVPPYVARTFREAVERAEARQSARASAA